MITKTQLAACRVALAALLHDLGKFAERARIPEAKIKDAQCNTQQSLNEGICCPQFHGRPTHIHAAYTAIAIDLLEKDLPNLVGEDMCPFAPWKDKNADDSLINAAAKHHRPDTFLQWIIASADRLASGFERETFKNYNEAVDNEKEKLNHYTTQQWTLLEGIHPGQGKSNAIDRPKWHYERNPLSPEFIFPVRNQDHEIDNNASAQKKYLALWESFRAGLCDIPPAHRSNLSLWLDHFESLWLTFTHAIPSATAGIGGHVRPDVSLYDHSKTTAALAVALWRYHSDLNHAPQTVREQLRAQWDKERATHPESIHAWDDQKFLLVQGDFFGIQNFIFAAGSQTQKCAAKLLRGRSLYVALLSELAALKVLETLELPTTSQVVNAAGKFLIVVPNTPETIKKLKEVQAEFDTWFLTHTYGQSGIGLAWLPAAARNFRQEANGVNPFRDLMKRLFEQLETAKLKRFHLCGDNSTSAIFDGFLDRFTHGECQIDGHSPACKKLEKEGDVWVSELAFDQIQIGKWLTTEDRILVTRERITGSALKQLDLPIFGYHLLFTLDEEHTGIFSTMARSGNLLRAWDFSLPAPNGKFWNGYARRHINAFVPRFTESDLNAARLGKYDGLDEEDRDNEHIGAPKTLNHLARDDRKPNSDHLGHWMNVEALMTLKGDVDNLGLIFQQGLTNPTFAKMAALSRQMNAFFAVYLPWLCAREFPNIYTVFAGGDDFFLIGPWHSTIQLARRIKDEFRRYVAENPDIHFSAGLSMTKPGLPIRQLASLAEEALDAAKGYHPDNTNSTPKNAAPKNAVTCFDQSVSWADFEKLMEREVGLRQAAEEHALSTGYIYGLIHFTEMAGKVKEQPVNAIWHSQFAYRTRRLAETHFKNIDDPNQRESARRRLHANLAMEIADKGIERYGDAYKIALFTYLYQQRD